MNEYFKQINILLTIFVVYVHCNFSCVLNGHLTNVLITSVSGVICQVAVPFYFLISGYRYFNKCSHFGKKEYFEKNKKRIYRLLIPYLIFNIVSIVYSLLIGRIATEDISLNMLWDYHKWGISSTAPFNIVLWYIRDLMVLSILSPIVWYIIKTPKILFFLCLLYLINIIPNFAGFRIMGFFYFSFGAYMRIKDIEIGKYIKYKNMFLAITLITMLFCIVFRGWNTCIGNHIMPIFTITFIVSSMLYKDYVEKYIPAIDGDYLFFVYLIHNICFTEICRFLFLKVCGNTIFECIVYIVSPILIMLLCYLLFMIIHYLSKDILHILVGKYKA